MRFHRLKRTLCLSLMTAIAGGCQIGQLWPKSQTHQPVTLDFPGTAAGSVSLIPSNSSPWNSQGRIDSALIPSGAFIDLSSFSETPQHRAELSVGEAATKRIDVDIVLTSGGPVLASMDTRHKSATPPPQPLDPRSPQLQKAPRLLDQEATARSKEIVPVQFNTAAGSGVTEDEPADFPDPFDGTRVPEELVQSAINEIPPTVAPRGSTEMGGEPLRTQAPPIAPILMQASTVGGRASEAQTEQRVALQGRVESINLEDDFAIIRVTRGVEASVNSRVHVVHKYALGRLQLIGEFEITNTVPGFAAIRPVAGASLRQVSVGDTATVY